MTTGTAFAKVHARLSSLIRCSSCGGAMSAWGHSRPGRGNSKSSHVRYAAEDGSRFRALAVTHRHGGLISYDGISCSPLFFGSCRGPGWVPHERERTQKIANCRRKKPRENKGVLLIQTAHNGLVAGSSPAGPTHEYGELQRFRRLMIWYRLSYRHRIDFRFVRVMVEEPELVAIACRTRICPVQLPVT